MTEIQKDPSLTGIFDDQMLHMLSVAPAMTLEERLDLLQQLPKDLDASSIQTVGTMAWNAAENPRRQHDGLSNGNRYCRQVLSSLAELSLEDGDYLTANSVIDYLDQAGGLANRLRARKLFRQLGRIRQTNTPIATSS